MEWIPQRDSVRSEWAERAGVCDYYNVTPEQLNDDRLERALERVAQHAFTIQSQLLLILIRKFKLDVSNIHDDISNVELYGDYGRQLKAIEAAQAAADSDEATDTSHSSACHSELTTTDRRQHGPMPMYGRTKSGRKNVKQVQVRHQRGSRRSRADRSAAVRRQ